MDKKRGNTVNIEIKERIMDAALEEFNEKGFKFTMDDVAKKLGMSKKTIYTVFREKEELFFAFADQTFDAIKEAEKEIIENPKLDIIEKIRRIIVVLPERYCTVDYSKLVSLQEKYPKVYAKVAERLESDWEDTIMLLQQAMEEGKIRQFSIPVFKCMVESTMEHFLSREILSENHLTYEQGLQELIGILMDGITLEKK